MAMQHAESQDGAPLGADVFVARQPIFSRRQSVYGYELLFRDGVENAFRSGDGSAATVSVIETGFLSIGLQQLTGGKPAFINFTRELLLADEVLRLPRREVVVEILEDIEPDEEVVEACAELRRRGFTLALDDYVFHAGLRPPDRARGDHQVRVPRRPRDRAAGIRGARARLAPPWGEAAGGEGRDPRGVRGRRRARLPPLPGLLLGPAGDPHREEDGGLGGGPPATAERRPRARDGRRPREKT